MGELFGGGFSVGAGNSKYWDIERLPVVLCQCLQAGEGIVNKQVLITFVVCRVINYGQGATCVDGFFCKTIAVGMISLQCKEYTPLGGIAAVNAYTATI